MLPAIGRIAIVENYIEPVIHHHVSQFIFKVIAETVKIFAAKMFLEFLCKQLLKENSSLSSQKIYLYVVVAPIVEEILFRGVLLNVIYLSQKALVKGDEREGKQRTFRVHLTAIAFGAAHLTNSHTNPFTAIFQCSWCYLSGVTLGYLAEKTHSISLGILAHGLNNGIAVFAMLNNFKKTHHIFIFCGVLVANQLVWYTYAKINCSKCWQGNVEPIAPQQARAA
jgi:hypothetical protein